MPCRCDPQDGSLSTGSLFIGGVNLFSLDESVLLRATEFVGTIRSVLINNSQIDLGCPTDQVNIMNGRCFSGVLTPMTHCSYKVHCCCIAGFHYTNACSTKQCENEHTAGCVDFAPEPYCKCIGGFPPASCQPLPDPDQEIDGSENSEFIDIITTANQIAVNALLIRAVHISHSLCSSPMQTESVCDNIKTISCCNMYICRWFV